MHYGFCGDRTLTFVLFVIKSRTGPERPYRVISQRFHLVGMHGRAGACRRGSFTGRGWCCSPLPRRAPAARVAQHSRGLAVTGIKRAKEIRIVSGRARGGAGWGCVRLCHPCARVSLRVARASACLASCHRMRLCCLTSGLTRAFKACVTPLVPAANDTLDGGRADQDRFAFRTSAVASFQIDQGRSLVPPAVPPPRLVV